MGDLDQLPANATTSHVKGLQIVNIVKSLRRGRAQIEHLLADDLKHYLDERIVVSSWYPVLDMHRLLELLTENFLGGDASIAGRMQALADFSGARSVFVKQDVEILEAVRSLARSWPLNYDHGRLELAALDGGVRIILHDWGIPTRLMSEMMGGYCQGAVESVGATNTRSRVVERHLGDPCFVELEVTWAERA